MFAKFDSKMLIQQVLVTNSKKNELVHKLPSIFYQYQHAAPPRVAISPQFQISNIKRILIRQTAVT